LTTPSDIEEIPADAPVDVTFSDLGLDPKIIKALDDIGYIKPTPIQAQAIPYALQQKDVLGIAQTGTGKTGAFTLPTMHKLTKGRARARMPRCLIICPTRELAAQVAENVEIYGKHLKLEMALLIGGVSFGDQDKKLMKGVDILIATPGRLLDQFERGKILMTGVQTLVVDEADRMLDMGFIPDIERIFKLTPFTRQVLFFSATMPDEIKRLVDQFLHQPATIQVARQSTTAETVTQRIVRMPSSDAKQKRTALRWVIDHENVKNGIVFCNRKRDVDIVAKSLTVHGHSAAPIHGDLPQSERTKTLDGFKNGEIKYLVASDVAARGLDVPSVSHVFNYDVPIHAEDYVHRIGRTGRAGREGDAIMFVARLDQKYYSQILKLIKVDSIDEIDVPGIEDFPTTRESGRRGRRKDKGRGRGRERGNRGKDGDRHSRNRYSHTSERTSDTQTTPTSTSDSQTPKSDKDTHAQARSTARRKAPSRPAKADDSPATDTKTSKPKTSRREPKPDPKQYPSKTSSTTSKSKSHARSKNKSAERSDKPSNNKAQVASGNSASHKPKRGRGRDSLPKNTSEGFGENMPAFFKSQLK